MANQLSEKPRAGEYLGVSIYAVSVSFICIEAIFQNKNVPAPLSDELAFSLFLATGFYVLLYYFFHKPLHLYGGNRLNIAFYPALAVGFAAGSVDIFSPKAELVKAFMGIIFLLAVFFTLLYLNCKTEVRNRGGDDGAVVISNSMTGKRMLLILQISAGIFFGLAPYYIIGYYMNPGWNSWAKLFLAPAVFLSGIVICFAVFHSVFMFIGIFENDI